MGPQTKNRAARLVASALKLPPAERRRHVFEAAAGDWSLYSHVIQVIESAIGSTASSKHSPEAKEVNLGESSFESLRLVNQGARSVVYEARQVAPMLRDVLLRVVDAQERDEGLEFEAAALASLNHDAVARVYEAGVDENQRLVMVMESVTGQPITRYCQRRKLKLEDRLRLFRSVCQGVGHAHQHRVYHRHLDAKKVLVSEDARGGFPKIIGFAIGEHGHRGAKLPAGAPPSNSPATEALRDDIQSLGFLLEELLEDRSQSVPLPLKWILRRAQDPESPEAYTSAFEFAADLTRFLRREPLSGKDVSRTARLIDFFSRNRNTTLLAGAVFGTVGLALLVSSVVIQRQQSASRLVQNQSEHILRLSDTVLLEECQRELKALGPPLPRELPAIEAWLTKAHALAERLPDHRAELAAMRQGENSFASESEAESQFYEEALATLVAELDLMIADNPHQGTIASIENRARLARNIERLSVLEHETVWSQAIESIADPRQSPLYGGLVIKPQMGLVPLGQNADSGLWEFWHVPTGETPRRDGNGELVLGPETGVVLALLPGDTFWMGAHYPTGRPGAGSRPNESPSHRISLDPFFIAIHELTQAQWMRITGKNPSKNKPENPFVGDLRLPVAQITWHETERALKAVALEIPTEAQWEYAARGGTQTMWWCGEDWSCLEGAENIADLSGSRFGQPPSWRPVPWDDGLPFASPVATLRANGFGLYDVAGNVMEWTRDGFVSFEQPANMGTGLRATEGPVRVVRGGGTSINHSGARSSSRQPFQAGDRDLIGVRPSLTLDVTSEEIP